MACDAFAAETLSAAYRTPVTLDADNHLMGRTAVIFQDFEGVMNTPADEQRASGPPEEHCGRETF